jgi:hypothetical protein
MRKNIPLRGGVSLSATGYFDDKVRVTELGYFNSPSEVANR